MRKWIAVCFVLVLASSTAAFGDDAAAVKKSIQAGFKASMAALGKKDIKGFLAFYTDDYEGTQQGMKVNKAALEQVMKGYSASTKEIHSASYEVANLKVTGNKATGSPVMKLDETIIDVQGMMGGAKGQEHRMKLEQHYTTAFAKSGGAWKVSKQDVGETKMWIDGKLFNPMAQSPGQKK